MSDDSITKRGGPGGKRNRTKRAVRNEKPAGGDGTPRKTRQVKAGRVKTLWYDHRLAVILLTTLLSLLSAIAIGYFNSWRAPQTFSAKFEQPRVESNVVLRNLLEQTGSSTSEYTDEQLAQVGYSVRYQLQLVGFEGRTCKVRWEVFDTEPTSRVQLPGWHSVQDVVDMTPEGASDIGSASFWVPPTQSGKPFFVRILVADDKGTDLTYIDTETITPRADANAKPQTSPNAISSPASPALPVLSATIFSWQPSSLRPFSFFRLS